MTTAATPLSITQAHGPSCEVCGHHLDPDGECDICSVALRDGTTIEEVRADIEDLARSMTARFASAEGRPCTCGAGSGCVAVQEGPRRGRGARPVGYIHFDVRHEDGCPRAPGPFDWTPVNEDARQRVFGYDGRTEHARRLLNVLTQVRDEREVLEC